MNVAIEKTSRRAIRSFVIRARLTTKQRLAIEHYWPLYGLESSFEMLNFGTLFEREAATIIEIGFGMGGSLLELATHNPHINFVGIEVHRPGVGALLLGIHERGLKNIRVSCADAIEVLTHQIPDNSLAGLLLFFPDPWPKKRHHKRRIVQSNFVNLIHQKLKPCGSFQLATDVADYAEHMKSIIADQVGFEPRTSSPILPNLIERPKTKFELRGEKLGHAIHDLVYYKAIS